MARTVRLIVVLAGGLVMTFASSGVAFASADGEVPSAKQVAKIAVKEQGPDAIISAFLALDRGYSTRQLVDGVLDHGLRTTGDITGDAGAPVAPVGPAPNVIRSDTATTLAGDDLGGSVSLDQLVEEVPESKARARLVLTSIILAAAHGYPLDDLIADGFLEEGFTGLGAIKDLPPPRPPDPDLLDDLLTGIAKAGGAPKPKKSDTGDPDAATFSGELTLGQGWTDRYGVGIPTMGESRIELRIKGERLVGEYFAVLDNPQTGGNCTISVTFDGTVDIPSDGVGFAGDATGTGTHTSNGRPGCPATVTTPVNWTTTVLRTSDDRLSGEMSYVGPGRTGMTITFEARAE